MDHGGIPDLTGAAVYVEAAERPIAGGPWCVFLDDRDIYRRPK